MGNDKMPKLNVEKPDVSATNASFSQRLDSLSVGSSFSDYGGDSGDGGGSASGQEPEAMEDTNPVKFKAVKYKVANTAVQHVSKHFDLVLGIDFHWTIVPPLPIPFSFIPYPLPHPFIGMIMDPMDYIHFTISVPAFLQERFSLPSSIPMGGSIYVHGRHKATTTTSVIGLAYPSGHITGSLAVYIIPFKPEAPHDGEVYYGSDSVLGQGSEMSGSDFQHVLTCWGLPMGHQMLPTSPGKPTKNPLAFMAFYSHWLSMYVQINTGNPVLVGGNFIPHVYTAGELLMRFAAMAIMKGLAFAGKKGLTSFNHMVQKMTKNLDNPVSRVLCPLGFEPVNFITGAMSFEWDDFEIFGSHTLKWNNIWESDNRYSGMLGNGVSNNYDLFIFADETDGVAAWKHPEENQAVPVPCVEIGNEFQYYRPWKLWQKRPDASTWVIKHDQNIYTYRALFNPEFGKIYRVEKIEYNNGGKLQFSYDVRGKVLTRIEDQAGRRLLFTHDSLGERITAVAYSCRKTEELLVRYEYDDRGNLVKVWDTAGKSIDFHYDAHNRVIRRVNRNGMEYTWEYDQEDRVVHTRGTNGFQEGRIMYFPEEEYNEVQYVHKAGKTERYYYDDNNLVYKEEDAMGGETWYQYNSFNERTLIGSPEGKTVGYEYDERGNISVYHTADGEQYIYEYDEENRLVYRSEPSGLSENWIYDAEGRLLHWKRLDNSQVDYFYGENERQPERSLDNNGLETRWEYNEQGQLVSVSNNRGMQQNWEYDLYGRLISQNTDEGIPTVWKRDAMGRVREFSTIGLKTLKIQYDAYDLPVCVTNGSEEWFMEYTPMGSLKKQSRRSVRNKEVLSTLVYDYNAYEQLTRIINEKGEQYIFTRNLNDAVISEQGFDGMKKEYLRNRDGQVFKTILPGDKTIYHDYDLAGRLVYNKYNDGFWESFEYDKSGLLVKADNLMSETEFTRNPFGQITKEKQGEHTLEYLYDETGRLTSLKSSLGAEVEYGYDPLGYLKSVTAQTEETLKNQFNPHWKADIQTDISKQTLSRSFTGGVHSVLEYDPAGRPLSQKVQVDEKETLHNQYRWQENFKLAETLNKLTGGRVHYDYDAFGSLSSARYEDGTTEYKNPDEVGNLYRTPERKDRTYDKGGKLIEDKNWYYYYDAEGNLSLKTRSSRDNSSVAGTPNSPGFKAHFLMADGETVEEKLEQLVIRAKQGKKINVREYEKLRRRKDQQEERKTPEKPQWQKGDWEYRWYANGMLRQVKKPDGCLVEFEYDALGRRTAKIVYEQPYEESEIMTGNHLKGKIFRYIWEGNVLLHEWSYDLSKRPRLTAQEDGTIGYDKEEPAEDITTWVYERESFTPCAKIRNGKKYSIISDYLGRPVQAYDALGKLIWEMELDIYGKPKRDAIQSVPFLYPGQYYDVETGLAYNRFRYYNPENGLYISKDPIGLLGNNPNEYAYVRDSNKFIDPSGLDEEIPQSFIDKYKDLIEANKSSLTGRPIDVDADMAEAWKWHQDAKIAVAEGKLTVLGNFDDVQSFTRGSNYYYRLMSERWSPAINDIWIDSLIEEKSSFLLISPTDNKSLSSTKFGETIYARELKKLEDAGYDVPKGDKTISGKNSKYLNYR